jgi:general secretion pathway protein E
VDIGNLEQYVKLSSAQELSSTDQHIKAAVNHLFNYALEQRASDIHVEPKRESCLIRYRIDGVLHTIYKLPKAVHSAITSRIKALARLDIAEKRRPQDGRIKIGQKDGKEAELRVSTIPVSFGEKTVMRILDTNVIFQDLDELGFSKRDKAVYNSFITAPHGIVLVTGPTGSGKSTTLYSTLKKIASPEINIITVEDPVEMVYEDFNQISVQQQIDVTFSNILRNILRQDPDVIMIGEMRDLETARIAIQSALTGHLVLSTIHTNDAAGGVTRMLDMGVEDYLLTSTVNAILAQRLVRTLDRESMEAYELLPELAEEIGLTELGKEEQPYVFYRPQPSTENPTGYRGRTSILELLPMTDPIRRLVMQQATSGEIQDQAVKEGMRTMYQDGLAKCLRGVTTLDEVLRVTQEA